MEQFYRNQRKWVGILVTAVVFSGVVHAQVIPTTPQTFSLSGNNPVSTRYLAVGGLNFVTVNAGTPSPSGVFSFLGDGNASGGPFRGSLNYAYIFNYARTNPGDVPYIPFTGQGGGGDYRMSFTPSGDTSLAKSGNFKINSMYLAIGSGNSATVIVQGFRAGKLISGKSISISPGMAADNTDVVNFTYTADDGFGGTNLSFGTNFAFLDGLRFVVSSADIPLAIDDLVFDSPDNIAPSSQASSAGFTPTGITSDISWTKGNGDYSAVFLAAASSGSPTIANGADYTANTVFGSGTAAGAGWFCVYNGTAATTTVTGLATGTTYRMKAVSYNGNAGYGTYTITEGAGVTSNIKNFTTIAAPATQASAIDIPAATITAGTAVLNWTNGNGVRRLVFVTAASSGTLTPVNNVVYTPSTTFGSGTSITAGTVWRCVFNGTGNTVTVSNLTANTAYRVAVIEYNDDGSSGGQTYSIATGPDNPDNFTTDAVPAVTTSAASGVSSSAATLNGSVNDRGATTTTSFQYATNSSLTSPSTQAGSPGTINAGGGLTTVTGSLSGLSPSTVYFYRVVGVNTVGIANGTTLSLTTAPVVGSINATTANGSYNASDVIAISITFSAAVTVTGTPTLSLNTGGTASYVSGSGTATLSFQYTVTAGENSADLDYTSTSALGLSGATITDAANNIALLTLPAVGGAGSIAGQKSIIIDTQVPTLPSVTILSNNANTALAKVNDIVTIAFTASETITSTTVTMAGHTVAATNTGANNWTATYTMANADASGTVSFSISFTDIAANAGAAVTTTTNSSSVAFDKTLPTLTAVTIVSSNANVSLAKPGDVVTLNFIANETLASTTVAIAGNTVAATNTGGNNWTASHTMTAADASGTIAFNISFTDLSGNAVGTVSATTNSSSVTFDKTPPTVSTVSILSDNSNTSLAKPGNLVTVNFVASETLASTIVTIAGNTVTATNTGGNNWTASHTMTAGDASGTVVFSITFSDPAGHAGTTVTATTNSSSVTFDKTSPALSAVSILSDNPNTSLAKTGNLVTLNFVSSETLLSAAATIGGNTVTATNSGGNNWKVVHTLTGNEPSGLITFNISFSDAAANTGTPVTATTNSSSVTFDKTAPTVSSSHLVSASPTNALSVQYTVNFSESVTGVDITDFVLTTTGLSGAAVSSLTGANAVYTVTVNTGAGDGTIRLDLNGSGTGIADLTGNLITAGYSGGQVYIINKLGLPVITAGPVSSPTCAGGTTGFSVTASSVAPLTYQWQVNSGSGFADISNGGVYSNVTTASVTITNAGTAMNNYQYRCMVSNNAGASNSAAALLTIHSLPSVGPITGAGAVCVGLTGTLASLTTGGVWSSSNPSIAAVVTGGIVTGIAPGNIVAGYTVTDVNGCVTMLGLTVTVNALPTVTIQPTAGIISRGNSIRLTASGSPGTTIVWTPAASLDAATSFTPLARPLVNTNYTATVTTPAGCKASAAITVLSSEDFTTISAGILFTPNGDGINDRFVIANIDAYPVNTLQVFNKTGKLVFQATNYHNEWDGTFNGRILSSDTYFYVFKVKETIVKKGMINLLVK